MSEINDLSIVDASNNTTGWIENQAPSTVNNAGRTNLGILSRAWRDSVEGTIDSAGTEPTYTVAANRTISAYYDGMRQGFHCHSTNASGAATLNIDGVGAKAITKFHNVALAANDLEADGYYEVIYSASDDAFQLVTPVANAPLTSIATNSIDGTMIAIGSDAIGDILYYDGTDYVVLAAGTDGYHLRAKGAAAPVWEDPGTNRIVQVVNTQDGAVATGTTVMVYDNTIPQNTEGDEYMTLAITPTNTSNILQIDVVAHLSCATADRNVITALFQDSTADALACTFISHEQATFSLTHVFSHRMTAGTTSATTFKVRAGASTSGTMTFNGDAGNARLGGTIASSITITEIAA